MEKGNLSAGELTQLPPAGNAKREFGIFLGIWLLSLAAILGGAAAQIRRYGSGGLAVVAPFALQLALYWLPGFPALRARIESLFGRRGRVFAIGAALFVPYLAYGACTGAWGLLPALKLLGLTALVLGVYVFAPVKKRSLSWQDVSVMLLVAAPLYTGWYRDIWPLPTYLDPMARLFAVALAAFAVLSVRPLADVGFEWRLQAGDWLEGGRQFLFYSAIGIPLGFAMRFIAWHPQQVEPGAIATSFVGIFLFIAVAEELFFRGVLQNLLEKSMKNGYMARAISSAIFGLSHIHHGFPNWRYVIMAAIAGWFYGTAWHARQNIIPACVTHAAVDTIWRHFLTA